MDAPIAHAAPLPRVALATPAWTNGDNHQPVGARSCVEHRPRAAARPLDLEEPVLLGPRRVGLGAELDRDTRCDGTLIPDADDVEAEIRDQDVLWLRAHLTRGQEHCQRGVLHRPAA